MKSLLKQKLRDEIKNKLKSENHRTLSKLISNKVLNFIEKKSFKQILAYYPMSYEVQIQNLLKLLIDLGFSIFLPKILKNKIDFFKYFNEVDLIKNNIGIKEPKSEIKWDINKSSFIIVPGLLFSSKNGYRIGHGKGFYDIFLSDKSFFKLGLCFDFQVLDNLPFEGHDIRVNMIITDKREICFND